MSMVNRPDSGQLERWLTEAGIEYYICDHCHGLHLSDMQGRDGVLDARLFVEEEGLLLTTELELKPSALFAIHADISRLNMQFIGLKVFIDINDETLPRLVICDLLIGAAGINAAQFMAFLEATLSGTGELHEECGRLGYLYEGDALDDATSEPGSALH